MKKSIQARRAAAGGLGAAVLGALLAVGTGAVPGREGSAGEQVLMWTADRQGQFTWDQAVAAAAAHVEGGFSDWRLPTIEELQAAVTDSDPATFGQTDPNVNYWSFWTSKKQGIWAFGVKVVTDANGYPVPSQSGQKLKHLNTSWLLAKFVRP